MTPRPVWPLVGRDEELRYIDRAAGVGPVVVGGRRGVGKTRLVGEWVSGHADGRRVVKVVATRATATIPFGAFAAWAEPPPDGTPAGRLETLRVIAGRIAGDDAPIVTVDDAHLLDSGSAAVVLHLALHTDATVVATVRSGEPTENSIDALWRDGTGTRLDLSDLSESDTAELVGRHLGGRVHPVAQQRLWTLSLGNPMYLREVTDAAIEQGQLSIAGSSWAWSGDLVGSPRLEELVAERLGRLEDALDRRALELVALGEPLDLDVLYELVGHDRVADLERRGLLGVGPSPADRKARLVHPLYAEILRAGIGRLATRRLRADLVRAASGRSQVSDPLRVAMWWLDAGDGGAQLGDISVELVVDGATRALHVQEFDLALRLARAAEQAGAGTPALQVQAEVLASLDRRAELDAVLARLDADPDPVSRTSTATIRAYLSAWARQDATEARRVLADAIAAAPTASRGVLTSTDATFAVHALDLDGAIAAAGSTCTTEPSTLSLRLQGLSIAGIAAALRGETAPAITLVDQHLADILAVTPDDPIPAGYAATGYHHAMAQAGRIDEAAAFFGHVLSDVDLVRTPAFRALPAWLLGRLETDRGRTASAIELLTDALDLMGDDSRFWFGRPVMAASDLAVAAAQAGDEPRASNVLAWAEARSDGWIAMTAAHRLAARAWVAAAGGCLRDAVALAIEAADHAGGHGANYLVARALLIAARCGGAADVASRTAEIAGRSPTPYAIAVSRFATALAGRDGDDLDAASAALAACGIRLAAAEAAAQAATVHAHRGLRQREAASRRRAHELLAACEAPATPLLIGLDHGPIGDDLTAREREVVVMVTAGRTNREIAAALHISLRTVNSHLNHAYTKLGTSDRHELERLVRPSPRPTHSAPPGPPR